MDCYPQFEYLFSSCFSSVCVCACVCVSKPTLPFKKVINHTTIDWFVKKSHKMETNYLMNNNYSIFYSDQ